MVRGFIVHGYAERRSGRILFAGRLEDGRSFAAALSDTQTGILIPEQYEAQALHLVANLVSSVAVSPLKAFDRGVLKLFRFATVDDRRKAAALFRNAQIPSPDADRKAADALLLSLGIRGPVYIEILISAALTKLGHSRNMWICDPCRLAGKKQDLMTVTGRSR